jgi:hypothetical protein
MVTDLPVTLAGFDAILVFVDRLTKMVHLVPCEKSLDAQGFVDLLISNVIRLHGTPRDIVSDRGSIFTAQFTKYFAQLNGILQSHSSAYHPQSDGQTEVMNRVLEDVLRCYVGTQQHMWDKFLPFVEFCINNSYSEATRNTPFLLNYGVNPRHPAIAKLVHAHIALHGPTWKDQPHSHPMRQPAVTLYAAALREVAEVPAVTRFTADMQRAIQHTKLFLEAARARMRLVANPRRSNKWEPRVGELVWLRTTNLKIQHGGSNKLYPRFVGPFPISRIINRSAVRLDLPSEMKVHPVFHISLLRPHVARPVDGSEGRIIPPPPPPIIIEDDEHFEVETILQARDKVVSSKMTPHGRVRRTKKQYLVKWLGYGHEHNQWKDEGELDSCRERLEDFLALQAKRPQMDGRRRVRHAQAAAALWQHLLPWG